MPRLARAAARSGARCSPKAWSSVRRAPVLGLLLAGPLVERGGPLCRALFRSRARSHGGRRRALARGRAGARGGRAARFRSPAPVVRSLRRLGLSGGSVRITPGTNRRLRIFATTQIACTFVLLAGAGMLVATLTALQTANTGYDLRQVLAIDLPARLAPGLRDPARESVLQEATRRIGELPGVEGVATRRERAVARPRDHTGCSLSPRGTSPRTAKKSRRAGCDTCPLSISRCSASRSSRAGISPTTTVPARNRGHRQPERGAAAVPERRRAQPASDAHQSGNQSWKSSRPPHRRHRRRRG